MPHCLVAALLLLLLVPGRLASAAEGDLAFSNLDAPEHDYWNRPLKDPFTLLKDDLEQGRLDLDVSNEKAYLESLLKALKIPASTQTVVYSTTSLQLSLISPRTPRSVYFNEDTYLGYVQGGRIEIVSIDPELGGIFYIFDIPREGTRPVAERSQRCMKCHADEDTHEIPGVTIKSVIPGPTGGTLESYRRKLTGHEIPISDRFGGWHVTGADDLKPHWGNLIGRFTPDGIVTTPLPPGQQFDWSVFPVETSDILAHLLHEHQAGFVNRVVQAHYRMRTALSDGDGRIRPEDRSMINQQVEELTRYLLFAGEATFPVSIAGDSRLKEDFLATRRPNRAGDSLKDFDLKTHLFRNRCSYMIYTSLFQSLPEGFKKLIFARMAKALAPSPADSEFSHLSNPEKLRIKAILKETLPGLPENW